MRFDPDIRLLKETVQHRDPSFRSINQSVLSGYLAALKDAQEGIGFFLLATMRLMALPGNGHSRVIPNVAIRTLPLRFVALATEFILVRGERSANGAALRTVNSVPISTLRDAARIFLSGTRQRQNSITPMLMAWPAALHELGVDLSHGYVVYEFSNADGSSSELAHSIDRLAPALNYYPVHETGHDISARQKIQVTGIDAGVLHIRLSNLKDLLQTEVQGAIARIDEARNANLVFDLRGNPGGNFFHALPLIEMLATRWRGDQCVILVDKFTFSAAIVCVALLIDGLGDRAVVMGEPMGDGFHFFAEGGTDLLPASNAQLRYSDALHDWERGISDATTPTEIAEKLVAVRLPTITPMAVSGHDIWKGLDPMLKTALNFLRCRNFASQ